MSLQDGARQQYVNQAFREDSTSHPTDFYQDSQMQTHQTQQELFDQYQESIRYSQSPNSFNKYQTFDTGSDLSNTYQQSLSKHEAHLQRAASCSTNPSLMIEDGSTTNFLQLANSHQSHSLSNHSTMRDDTRTSPQRTLTHAPLTLSHSNFPKDKSSLFCRQSPIYSSSLSSQSYDTSPDSSTSDTSLSLHQTVNYDQYKSSQQLISYPSQCSSDKPWLLSTCKTFQEPNNPLTYNQPQPSLTSNSQIEPHTYLQSSNLIARESSNGEKTKKPQNTYYASIPSQVCVVSPSETVVFSEAFQSSNETHSTYVQSSSFHETPVHSQDLKTNFQHYSGEGVPLQPSYSPQEQSSSIIQNISVIVTPASPSIPHTHS